VQLELAGKKALITGSSRGIGRAIAGALHKEGCHVVLNGRNIADVTLAASELAGAIGITGDVCLPNEARRIISDAIIAMDGLDILICNVGSGRSVPPGKETFEEWQRVFEINLWSTTNMVEAAREALSVSQGTIVCISSICGLEVVPDAPVTYSAAKAALHAYVRGIAHPLGEQGIRINAIAAGNVFFDDSVWSRKMSEDAKAVQQMLDRDVALGRLGGPQEIANLATYLASPCSGFATGAVWKLDGGQARC